MEYKLNNKTLQIEPDTEMTKYIIITELNKSSYDDIYEIIGDLSESTRGKLYQALRDQMDYED